MAIFVYFELFLCVNKLWSIPNQKVLDLEKVERTVSVVQNLKWIAKETNSVNPFIMKIVIKMAINVDSSV